MPKKTKSKKKEPTEAEERQALTVRIEGDLPYDRQTYISETRFFVQRSANDIVEAGKRLLIIHEKEGYGNFGQIVEEEIGISRMTAYRFMNAATFQGKFPKIALVTQFTSASKIYALTEAPEEELKKFEQMGLFAGKDADEIAAMSTKELRQLIADLKAGNDPEIKKLKDTIELQTKNINMLKAQLPSVEPDEYTLAELTQVEALMNAFDARCNKFLEDPRVIMNDSLKARFIGIYQQFQHRSEVFLYKHGPMFGIKIPERG